MRKKAIWVLQLVIVCVILGVVLSGCGPIKSTKCVTQITENCKAGYAKVNGITMYYEVHGSGEPLFILHGLGDSIETMKYGIIALSENYQVIAVDTRGHGRTTYSDELLSNELFAKDFIALMDILEIDKAHVVGLSDGGVTGLTMAIYYPDRVNKLVTIGANFSPDGMTDLVIEYMSNPENIEWVSVTPIYRKYAPDPSKWHDLIEKMWEMSLSGPNYTQDELGKIQAPVLVMLGERDNLIRVEHTEELDRMIPNSILNIVPKAGHNVFEINSQYASGVVDVANESILEFLMAE